MEAAFQLHREGEYARCGVEGDTLPPGNYQGRAAAYQLRWRHTYVLWTLVRIKEAEAAYHPPKVKKSPEVKAKNKGEAQLTITVIAENEQPAESKLE